MDQSVLQSIRDIRKSVGRSVNDFELTELIKAHGHITESGFRFLLYLDKIVTFDVPEQDISRWYREEGWVSEEKERILGEITSNSGLEIIEPPDYPKLDQSVIHHHFELFSGKNKVLTIHPKFLKILVPEHPVIPEENILTQLALLYK